MESLCFMKQFRNRLWQSMCACWNTIRTCFALSLEASTFYTILRLAGSLFPSLLAVLTSLMGKYLLDLLAGTWVVKDSFRVAIGLLSGMLAVALCSAVLQKAGQYAQTMHEDIMRGMLSLKMMEKASKADIEYFDNPEYYDKMTACMRDISAIGYLLWNAFSVVSASISFGIIFLILSQKNVGYSLIMLAAAVPASIASARYIKQIYHLSLEQINGERKKSYLQSLTVDRRYVKSIKLFDVGHYLQEKYQRIWKELFQERKHINRARTVITICLECLPEIAATGIGVSLVSRVLNGLATVGDYSLYSGLVSKLWSSIFLFSSAIMQILDNQMKIKNLKSLDQYENHVIDTGKQKLSRIKTIEFNHVGFTYPGTEKQVLSDVSFKIHSGERVALVGLNGSGKSTLIKLLLRFYDVDTGNIRINGVDIREYQVTELRKNFSTYFQDEPSYCFSLGENIRISDIAKEGGADAVMDALKAGCCEEILEMTHKGLDAGLTRVMEDDGLELSIGQYQKIALARAFFRRHTALILDEPSSSLDPKAEHMLFAQLDEMTKGKIVLFTSHRLTNIGLAEQIVVLEHGKIIEMGTQEKLLEINGRYAELLRYQQEHYMVRTQKKGVDSDADSSD